MRRVFVWCLRRDDNFNGSRRDLILFFTGTGVVMYECMEEEEEEEDKYMNEDRKKYKQ